MNNCSISGKVALPPKVGKTATNSDFVKFIVEVDRPKGKDGKATSDRINVGCWGKICSYAQYIEQGDIVELTGPISTTAYQKDGQWVNLWEVSAKTVKIIQKTVGTQPAQVAPNPIPTPIAPPPVVPMPTTPPPEDDPALPFDIMGGYYG